MLPKTTPGNPDINNYMRAELFWQPTSDGSCFPTAAWVVGDTVLALGGCCLLEKDWSSGEMQFSWVIVNLKKKKVGKLKLLREELK